MAMVERCRKICAGFVVDDAFLQADHRRMQEAHDGDASGIGGVLRAHSWPGDDLLVVRRAL